MPIKITIRIPGEQVKHSLARRLTRSCLRSLPYRIGLR